MDMTQFHKTLTINIMPKTRLKIQVLIIVFLCFINVNLKAQNTSNFEIGKAIDIYATILKELNINYVDSIDVQKLLNTSVRSMLNELDPYTVFVTEEETDVFDMMTRGAYGGIGLAIHQEDEKVVIAKIYKNFAAYKAGLKTGDQFLALNDSSIKGKTSSEVSDILKDIPGTAVKIRIKRPGLEKPIEFNIIRETIKIKNVPYYTVLEDNIGYIILTGFSQDAALEVRTALLDLKQNHKIKSLILDLRGNGGGIINEAANILSLFLPRGTEVVKTKGKIKEQNIIYKTRTAPVDKKIPIVVLVDNNSASSSEIVAGALQDLDRAVIMGQRTFGKGLVQQIIPLRYNTKAKLTIAKYYIPSGRCIQEINYTNDRKTQSDSLIVYRTKNGRSVNGGKGIAPDLLTKRLSLNNITVNLYAKLLIFNFVTEYCKNKDSIASVKDYVFTDEEYNEFLKFIADKDYSYKTESEKSLERLKKHAENENYYEAIKLALADVEKAMIQDKEADLVKHKEEIKKIISLEILTRYYYDEGRIEASLIDDPGSIAAIELIKNLEKYKAILSDSEKN